MSDPKVKITSDGTPMGTKVIIDGKEIGCVLAITIQVTPEHVDAVITFMDVELDITSNESTVTTKQATFEGKDTQPVLVPLDMADFKSEMKTVVFNPIKDSMSSKTRDAWATELPGHFEPDPSYYSGKK
jgi:hypothetical protein